MGELRDQKVLVTGADGFIGSYLVEKLVAEGACVRARYPYYSYRAPDSYVSTNVKGTLYLCQTAQHSGVRRFIQTSTSEVYRTAEYVPVDEKHPLKQQSPYTATVQLRSRQIQLL